MLAPKREQIPALSDAILPLSSTQTLAGLCPSDTTELNNPAASLKDTDLLPSGEKTHGLHFLILQTHPADIVRKAMPDPLKQKHSTTTFWLSSSDSSTSGPDLWQQGLRNLTT